MRKMSGPGNPLEPADFFKMVWKAGKKPSSGWEELPAPGAGKIILASSAVRRYIRQHPWKSVLIPAIALIVGFLIYFSIKISNNEPEESFSDAQKANNDEAAHRKEQRIMDEGETTFLSVIAVFFLARLAIYSWNIVRRIRAHRHVTQLLLKNDYLPRPSPESLKNKPAEHIHHLVNLRNFLQNYIHYLAGRKITEWPILFTRRQDYWNATMAIVLSVDDYMAEHDITNRLRHVN